MIPPIIHQTWKDDVIPDEFAAYAQSWNRSNPSWRRILWTDRMLLDFVEQNYPDLLDLYCAYPNGVCRADAARYMLLHKFGGLYADIDVECLASLDFLEGETRVVLCHEPPAHWPDHAPHRGHPFILFNGVMASPVGHPFWREVLYQLPETKNATDILDMTGPCMLTGRYLGFEKKDSVVVHDCQLFSPKDKWQMDCPPYGDPVPTSLTRHDWAGTWIPSRQRKRTGRNLINMYHRVRYHLTMGPTLNLDKIQRQFDSSVLKQSPPKGDRLAILVPVRDAAGHLDAFVEMVATLDIPKAKTKLVFCEGDSVDGTRDKLTEIVPELSKIFREVIVLTKSVGTRIRGDRRWKRRIQRSRRAGIAAVRNHLIDHGLDEKDDWAFWIDVDVWRMPITIFQVLRSSGARIVVPNCVKVPGGTTFDMNSFVSTGDYPRGFYYRHVRNGLFQPPPRASGRIYLDCVRHSQRIELDGVGGATLLVDASLHRAGLRFPQIPYKDLIETGAFGMIARDLGVRAVGLPQIEVLHAPY